MKTNLFAAFLLCTLAASAQSVIKIENGIATLDSKQWLIVQKTPLGSGSDYVVLKNFSDEVIAQLTFTDNGDKVYFRAEFRGVARKYEINYPAGTAIQTILESFNKNKVIVDNRIDLSGLQAYCDFRKIPLMRVLTAQEQNDRDASIKTVYSNSSESNKKNESQGNSIKALATGRQPVSFTLKNNSSRPVRYFIGSDPKYGSGTTSTTGGNTLSSEHGNSGDKFCIVDEHDNPISCTTLGEGMSRIDINSSGTGFGN